jgi:hypothetical protein
MSTDCQEDGRPYHRSTEEAEKTPPYEVEPLQYNGTTGEVSRPISSSKQKKQYVWVDSNRRF